MARGFSLRRVFPAWWLRPEQTKALLGGSPSWDFSPAIAAASIPCGTGGEDLGTDPPRFVPSPFFVFLAHFPPPTCPEHALPSPPNPSAATPGRNQGLGAPPVPPAAPSPLIPV